MKMTLLVLWSLGYAPILGTGSTDQAAEAASISSAYQQGPVVPTPQLPAVGGIYAAPEKASIGDAPATQFNEFTSPCGDCNGGYGGDRRNGCRGCRGGSCCRDSTCDMRQHAPYAPNNHGYYYFAPYNYAMIWQHQKWIISVGGDPRNPYSRAMFIPVYEQLENTMYDPDSKPSQTLSPLVPVSKKLPELESLIKKPSEGEIPTTGPDEPTPIDTTPGVPNPPEPDPTTSGLRGSDI